METFNLAQDFSSHCYSRGLRPKTLEYYEWAISKLVRHCREMPTCAAQITGVYDDPALGRKSKEGVERAIRIFLAWAEARHGHPNPLRGTKRMPKAKILPRVLRHEEIGALWEACSKQRERAMVALLLDTGIRLGELAGLRWPDVGREALRVDGKTGPRVIPVSPSVRAMFDGLGDSMHLWVSRHGPMTRTAIQTSIRVIFRRAGVRGPKLGPHTLRHTFATHYVNNGGNLVCLQQILGHSSITTTELYLHLSASMLKADHAMYSPVRCVL